MKNSGGKPDIHIVPGEPPNTETLRKVANLSIIPKPTEEGIQPPQKRMTPERREQCVDEVLHLAGQGTWKIKRAIGCTIYLGPGVDLSIDEAPNTTFYLTRGATLHGDFDRVYDVITGEDEELYPKFLEAIQETRERVEEIMDA